MYIFLLVVHALIAALLVTFILLQRSEGGGLTTGGNPAGLMSARGAADFLSRGTAVLATIFVVMSILLAVLATREHAPSTIDTSLAGKTGTAAPAPAPAPTGQTPAAPTAPAPAENGAVPLAR